MPVTSGPAPAYFTIMARSPSLSRPGARTSLVAGLLGLALVTSGLLAWQAWDAHRSHRRVAESTLRELAASAAWQFASGVQRSLYAEVYKPGLEFAGQSGGKTPEQPLDSLGGFRMRARVEGWSGGADVDLIFRQVVREGRTDWSGEPAPSPAFLTWLAEGLPAEAEALTPWQPADRLDAEGRLIAFTTYTPSPEVGPVVFGIRLPVEALRRRLEAAFDTIPLLPPSLTKDRTNAEILHAAVDLPGGVALFRSPPSARGPDAPAPAAHDASGRFPFVAQGLPTRLGVRPEAAGALVPGGLPRGRLPLVFGLLLATGGLVAVVILQVRREAELSRLRADFVSSVSHELRTPLAQIRMFAETLALGRVRSEEEERRSFDILVQEARRLSAQVDNVLLFSRTERGALSGTPRPLDARELLDDLVAGFRPLAEASDVTVVVEAPAGLTVRADESLLRQAVLNLLDNAVKYGPRGQTVRVGCRSTAGGRVEVWVADEGPGIPAESRTTIWDPYVRLDAHRETHATGSGIGLAVVRKVAEHHGGGVRVESNGGRGARFVLELAGGAA